MNLKPGDKFQLKGGQDWWTVWKIEKEYVHAYLEDSDCPHSFWFDEINPDTIIRKQDEPKYVEKVMYAPIIKNGKAIYASDDIYETKEQALERTMAIGYTEVKVWVKE